MNSQPKPSFHELKEVLSKLKNKKSPGKDMILNEMLKVGRELLKPVLVKLFNNTFFSGLFPDLWKNNLITMIYKSGPTADPNNYRGISINSSVLKLFCSILNKRVNHVLKIIT